MGERRCERNTGTTRRWHIGKWIGEDMAVFPNEPLLKAARELRGM
jgi:hypothetical protein